MKHLGELSKNLLYLRVHFQDLQSIEWYQMEDIDFQFASHHSCLALQSIVRVVVRALEDNIQTIQVNLASNRSVSFLGMLLLHVRPNHFVQTVELGDRDSRDPIGQTIPLLRYLRL